MPNFLQTNHLDFRLFQNQSLAAKVKLPDLSERGPIALDDATLDNLQTLLLRFFDAPAPPLGSAEAVAKQLAWRARLLRFAAEEMLNGADGPLHTFWNLYKETLFADISAMDFADVYAQTFTYGLFLAWLNTQSTTFDRDTALRAIPDAVPAIQVLMDFAGGRRLPESFVWLVDGICRDLQSAERSVVLRRDTGKEDPLIHFYEPFLAYYDAERRERAGVYYTPDAVVDFLVRAVDDVLKTELNRPEGLASDDVRLLDPATGTATFLARAYRQVHETVMQGDVPGTWPDVARNHLMRHFYGFERLPAAYTLAHVKLRETLREFGIVTEEHLPVYMVDTMTNIVPAQSALPGPDILTREVRQAMEIRNDGDILVVLGNPPYFGKSSNPSRDKKGNATFIGAMMNDYFKVDGQKLEERNPKWLQNDYVKFLRFAQWRIEQTGSGIVAFITDNSYLDNPTFRVMRQQLLRSFDTIHLLDLHGNSKKKERTPDGGRDENVFDITQGVAIAVFVRRPGSVRRQAVVHHADVWGSRQGKYDLLYRNGLKSVTWQTLAPNAPFYLFRPQDQTNRAEYEQGMKITEIMPVNVLGFQSHRDHFAVAYDAATIEQRISDLRNSTASDEELKKKYAVTDNRDWQMSKARARLRQEEQWKAPVTKCLYRPFDTRHCYYDEAAMDYPRREIKNHILHRRNFVLNVTRQTHAEVWRHALVSNLPAPAVCVEIKDGSSVFPLYIYPNASGLEMGGEREANLNPQFVAELTARTGGAQTPEDIFHYIYGVLHAPAYRTRYAEFLKIDFPRIPLPPNAEAFRAAAAVGANLVGLHLLESPELQRTGIRFPTEGSHVVAKRKAEKRYVPDSAASATGRVYLNDAEYFENVPRVAWEFRVGGYLPAQKWLEDRAERALTLDDIRHYQKMIAALRETSALLPQADAAFRLILSGQFRDGHAAEGNQETG